MVGKIGVGSTKSKAEDNTVFLDVTLTNRNWNEDSFENVDSDAYIEPGQRAVLSFADDADDVVIEFGDDAYYEFNARGQGRVNFAYNTNFDRDFAYDYDHANIDFINFEYEPSFNKIGRVYIYAPEDAFIYKRGAEGAEAISGLEWDPDYEAWTFKTRTLENYVISDVELDEKTVTEDKDDTTTDGGKTNPDTGR